MLKIITYTNKYKTQTIKLILDILEQKFNVHKKRQDLEKIAEIYQKDNGNFWLALNDKNKVIGAVGLLDFGQGQGYLKRMYVKKEYRSKGIAQLLLSALIKFAKTKRYTAIFLATREDMPIANRFYQKEGFKEINKLPQGMPSFGDTVFYKMEL